MTTTAAPAATVHITDRDVAGLQRRWRAYSARHAAVAFSVTAAGGSPHVIGAGEPAFTITMNDESGRRAVTSLDQFAVAVAYVNGNLSVDGDMQQALQMRKFFADFHPIAFLGRWAPALLKGRREHDRRSISKHYDEDSEFFLTFLDERHRCYTEGVFSRDDEPLEDAMTRKMDLAIEALNVRPGARVLEVGGGWGAFAAHAARRGLRVTTLTLAAESERFLNDLFARENLSVEVVRQHLFSYRTNDRFDAIVNMGVTEHLPDYRRTIRKYQELLNPGGRVYLDALAMRHKLRLSTFMKKFIYPGNSAPLLLHGYLAEVAKSPFELISVVDDRHNYYLTCREWALRLDRAKDTILAKWGAPLYNRFRIFLWGSAAGFDSGLVQAYRWVLQLPER